ncbi:MAG TPA: hypothetical protein VFS21_29815 [Roseiflexaceae bacterium]|nr:hypothetical protein [Roseiflexaceae bacterium]
MRAGIQAFREAFLSSDLLNDREFSAFEARALRYDLLWALYENTAYRDIHTWARKLRGDFGLYKHIRGIHNPVYRLVEFHVTHLLGGALDPQAGDGTATPSAIPIVGAQASLRRSIATLWRDSNWQIQKDIWSRQGSCLGDVGLKVVDDVARGKVYLQIVHPGTIREIARDPWGNVKGYVIEEERRDPRPGRSSEAPSVRYTETATRDGDQVVYRTLLNGAPYDWTGTGLAPEWFESYGFVPLVMTQHLNVGLDWGWSELHAGLPKFREVDDTASALSDQIRKLVNSPWLFIGVDRPDTTPRTSASTVQPGARTERGREEIPALYGPAGADAKPLVAPLPLGEVGQRITDMISEIERDYPELQMDIWTAGGDASGRALRVARQRVSSKVQQRRASYDDSLRRAQQMAVAIAGHRGYDGYRGFSLDSYAAGRLDHQIGPRPVFEVDPLDDIEQDTAFWNAARAAESAGYPLELYLRRKGWPEAEIQEMVQARAERAERAVQVAQAAGAPASPATNTEPQAS